MAVGACAFIGVQREVLLKTKQLAFVLSEVLNSSSDSWKIIKTLTVLKFYLLRKVEMQQTGHFR